MTEGRDRRADCDETFDALTRGAFPTAAASDQAVERHLRACDECRRLAAALRPALEALSDDADCAGVLGLPSYWGDVETEPPAAARTAGPGTRVDRSPLAAAAIAAGTTAVLLLTVRFGAAFVGPGESTPESSRRLSVCRWAEGGASGEALGRAAMGREFRLACCTQCHAADSAGPTLAPMQLASLASRCGDCHVN